MRGDGALTDRLAHPLQHLARDARFLGLPHPQADEDGPWVVGRFSKGSIKVLGRNRIALALAFFVDAVNTRLIINMPGDFYEQWTGEPPYLPDDEDPAWWDGDHPPQPTRAGPPESDLTTSPAQPERIAS